MPRDLLCLLSIAVALALTGCSHTDCHDDDCAPEHEDMLSVDIGTDASTVEEAEALCQCLLVACHDDFHAKYGEGDEVAIPACQAEARGIDDAARTCRKMACDALDCEGGLGGGSCE